MPITKRLSLRAIARTAQVSRTWLQGYVNALYRDVGRWAVEPPERPRKKNGDLVIEADALWSFVGSKKHVAWVWVALDADTRRVVALVVGDRSEFTAQCLWDLLPAECREHAVFCKDFLPSYRAVIPEDRHAAAGKEEGLTNHVERFWCTLRQRCGRFARKTLSFSKCWENHIGALRFFISLYNSCR